MARLGGGFVEKRKKKNKKNQERRSGKDLRTTICTLRQGQKRQDRSTLQEKNQRSSKKRDGIRMPDRLRLVIKRGKKIL